MINLSPEIVVVIMLVGMLAGVLSGFPLAYVIGLLALVTGVFRWQGQVIQILYIRTFSVMMNYTLLAVPLFVFMGSMLERSGIVEKLYDALYLWLGGIRGGLAVVTVVVGTIMAATVGVTSASVSMLTLIALPSMVKRGYDKSFASGVVCASGVLGILIPPSIMIVLYGPMANLSVGRLLFAAFVPGFLLAGLYLAYTFAHAVIQPEIAPPVPAEERAAPFRTKTVNLLTSLVPPAVLVMSVLGVIFLGIAPPTEAAAIGAVAATLLVVAYRRFKWAVLTDVLTTMVKLSGFAFLLGSMSFAYTGVFLGSGGGKAVTEAIVTMPGGVWGAFIAIQVVVFLLGFFVDWLGIVFIMVPIITPIGESLGFDPIWFATMVMVNLQTSFLTPPFAMAGPVTSPIRATRCPAVPR